MPIGTESASSATQQRQYYTVDEALAYLEPRIRAMFRYNLCLFFIFPDF